MKSKQQLGKNSWIPVLSTVFVVGLAACDSDGGKAPEVSSDSSASSAAVAVKRNMPTGPATGILVDSPVSGVAFAAVLGAAVGVAAAIVACVFAFD